MAIGVALAEPVRRKPVSDSVSRKRLRGLAVSAALSSRLLAQIVRPRVRHGVASGVGPPGVRGPTPEPRPTSEAPTLWQVPDWHAAGSHARGQADPRGLRLDREPTAAVFPQGSEIFFFRRKGSLIR